MTDTSVETAPGADNAAADAAADERLAFRGVFQRLFIRPEIGAMIGAVGIWVFFWAVAVPFGTANGASNILDTASTLGIMAVAVSMLMIGGEFDLSSGANTGAMAILTILLIKETGDLGGAGLSLWIALPISFLAAMGIGYFNGTMVERTALPSFIVTLGTFFVLKGAKLGFSKLIVDQIQVGRMDEAQGYDFWRPIFAAEWDRTTHQFGGRDWVYSIGVVLGLTLLTIAVYELYFQRRSDPRPAGAVQFLAGAAVGVVGVVVLHSTDSTGGNWLGGAAIAAGVVIGLVGLCVWRYEPLAERGSLDVRPEVLRPVGLGVVSIVLSAVFALIFDPADATNLFFPFTEQGLRATLFGAFAVAGFTLLMVGAHRALRVNATTKFAVSTLIAVLIAGMAFFVQSESQAAKFRAEAFSVILFGALLLFAWALVGLLFTPRQREDHHANALGIRIIIVGLMALLVGLVVKLLFTTDDEIAAGIAPAKFSMRTVWFVAFTAVMVWVLGRTRFGSWTFAVGGNKEASRQVGVPAARTKTQLFMLVSGAAWLVGLLIAFRINSIQANTGDGEEFEYIIAAVVGGTLLTGGYGTALGGAIGALIMSMATLGIPSARWNSDWRFLFLGVILLLAVIANRSIRTRAEALRR